MLEIIRVTKHYPDNGKTDGVHVLENFSLTVRDGETVALTGESGCGKSTLARLICGFEKPTAGSIRWDGKDVFALARNRQAGIQDRNGAGTALSVQFSDKTYITRNLLLNASSPLTQDKRLRLAIEYAINKDEIIDTVLHGIEVKADTLFTRDMPYCNVALTPYHYDKALAECPCLNKRVGRS